MPRYDSAQRRDALRKFLEANKFSVLQWTKAAGLTESSLRHFLAGRSRSLGDETYEKLARAASELVGHPVSASELRGELPPRVPIVATTQMIRIGRMRAPTNTVLDHAEFAISPGIVGWAPRPAAITNIPHISSFSMPADYMDPWREAGQLLYIERVDEPTASRKIPVGDYVVLEALDQPDDDDASEAGGYSPVVVGRLVEATAQRWVLQQYKPFDRIIVEMVSVGRVYRVVDWPELLGIEYRWTERAALWQQNLRDFAGDPKD